MFEDKKKCDGSSSCSAAQTNKPSLPKRPSGYRNPIPIKGNRSYNYENGYNRRRANGRPQSQGMLTQAPPVPPAPKRNSSRFRTTQSGDAAFNAQYPVESYSPTRTLQTYPNQASQNGSIYNSQQFNSQQPNSQQVYPQPQIYPHSSTIQSNPIQSNPIYSSPIISSPSISNPIQNGEIISGPIVSSPPVSQGKYLSLDELKLRPNDAVAKNAIENINNLGTSNASNLTDLTRDYSASINNNKLSFKVNSNQVNRIKLALSDNSPHASYGYDQADISINQNGTNRTTAIKADNYLAKIDYLKDSNGIETGEVKIDITFSQDIHRARLDIGNNGVNKTYLINPNVSHSPLQSRSNDITPHAEPSSSIPDLSPAKNPATVPPVVNNAPPVITTPQSASIPDLSAAKNPATTPPTEVKTPKNPSIPNLSAATKPATTPLTAEIFSNQSSASKSVNKTTPDLSAAKNPATTPPAEITTPKSSSIPDLSAATKPATTPLTAEIFSNQDSSNKSVNKTAPDLSAAKNPATTPPAEVKTPKSSSIPDLSAATKPEPVQSQKQKVTPTIPPATTSKLDPEIDTQLEIHDLTVNNHDSILAQIENHSELKGVRQATLERFEVLKKANSENRYEEFLAPNAKTEQEKLESIELKEERLLDDGKKSILIPEAMAVSNMKIMESGTGKFKKEFKYEDLKLAKEIFLNGMTPELISKANENGNFENVKEAFVESFLPENTKGELVYEKDSEGNIKFLSLRNPIISDIDFTDMIPDRFKNPL